MSRSNWSHRCLKDMAHGTVLLIPSQQEEGFQESWQHLWWVSLGRAHFWKATWLRGWACFLCREDECGYTDYVINSLALLKRITGILGLCLKPHRDGNNQIAHLAKMILGDSINDSEDKKKRIKGVGWGEGSGKSLLNWSPMNWLMFLIGRYVHSLYQWR